jgi:ferredoxin
MAYVVTEPCIGVKDKACMGVCPTQCFYEDEAQLYIHPDECVDCGACEPECPVEAIFLDEDVPEKWKRYVELNAQKSAVLPAAVSK